MLQPTIRDAYGNVQWSQIGTNSAARTYAYYSSTGQYAYSLVPGRTERDSVVYDGTFGNPIRFRDRRGNWTSTARDELGRSRLDSAQISAGVWRTDSTEYDLADRAIRQVSFGPATSYSPAPSFNAGFPAGNTSIPAQTLYVRNTYDQEGNVTEVARWGVPNPTSMDTLKTYFSYDGAGRKTTDGSNPSGELHLTYDPAGNLLEKSDGLTRITMEYDVMGRVRHRMTRATQYPLTYCRSLDPYSYEGACNYSFPLYTDGASGLTINGDTAIFDYDRGGNMIRADNQHAKVRRSYSPGGLLLTDTLRTRTLRYETKGSITPAADFTSHVYGVTYTYDASGRRATLSFPGITGLPASPQQYAYEPGTGRLSSIIDVRGQTFSFAYTLAGQLDYLTYPGGVVEHPSYDPEGQPSTRTVGGLISDFIYYDPMGRVSHADGLLQNGQPGNQHYTNWYTGLGAMAALEHDLDDGTPTLEEFRYDVLANQYLNKRYHFKLGNADEDPESRVKQFDLAGRILRDTSDRAAPYRSYDNYWYDGSGRTQFRYSRNVTATLNEFVQDAHYYSGLGKLAMLERHVGDLQQASLNDPQELSERYRYDALGRRVLTHSLHRYCTLNGCESAVQRFVWDGDQLLYEIRTRASNAASDAQVESDVDGGNGEYGAVNAYGQVAYTHAGGIDRPIGAMRLGGGSLGVAFYPQTNWRGQYELATIDNGTKLPNDVAWPGKIGSAFLGATPRATPYEWFGGLVTEQADASGLLYRRNRYYDPRTARFTQPDPIGVAGGVNAYGFAGGDPVNYADPFGLWGVGLFGRVSAKLALFTKAIGRDFEAGGGVYGGSKTRGIGVGGYAEAAKAGGRGSLEVSAQAVASVGVFVTNATSPEQMDQMKTRTSVDIPLVGAVTLRRGNGLWQVSVGKDVVGVGVSAGSVSHETPSLPSPSTRVLPSSTPTLPPTQDPE